MDERTKSRFEVAVTSYGRNKNLDEIKKNIAGQVKKQLARKRISVQTQFSHSSLKLEQKNFTPQNHSFFCSTSCFGVIKITTTI